MYPALLKVQKEIGAIKKDSDNPFFKSKYFDINGLLAVVKPVLNKHGFILTQALTFSAGEKLALRTTLTFAETGEQITDCCILPDESNPQKAGSSITYFRRYAIQSLLALEAEDDDGNSSSEKHIENPTYTKKSFIPKSVEDVPFP